MPDAMDNKFELVYSDREDAAELKNLPIGKWPFIAWRFLWTDDNMEGIIEEEEKEEEGSDNENNENAEETPAAEDARGERWNICE